MFGVIKRNRPIIPTRLPESVDPPRPAMEAIKLEKSMKLPENSPVAEEAENIETPPLTPASDTGEVSTDEPSVEEPTVEEACKVVAIYDENGANRPVMEAPDETDDSDDGISVTDDENDEPLFGPIGHKICWIWFLFWTIALAGGVFSYYLNTHQDLSATRVDFPGKEDMNFLLMPREKWDDATDVVIKASSYIAQRVVILQTETESCDGTTSCVALLNKIKREEGILKYNFLLSTDGCIFEGLGWQEPSPLYSDIRTMVIGFIGNYETTAPSTMQLSQLESLLEVSEEMNYLADSYTVLGRKQNIVPSRLFAYLSSLSRWDKENSDTNEQYIEVEFEHFPIFEL